MCEIQDFSGVEKSQRMAYEVFGQH
jgi:hypothetical protein